MEKNSKLIRASLVAVLLVGSLTLLPGCNNRAETLSQSAIQGTEFKAMEQSWRGTLPCADCEGIDTSLFLAKDGTWVMNQHYQGGKQPLVVGSWGTWARTADKLILTDNSGEKIYFRARGNELEMLDREGLPIKSSLNYRLQPINEALPSTPLAMHGMYRYMADAASFTDCVTHRTFPVKNNPQLERGYANAGGLGLEGVYMTIQAHFGLEANMDTGAPQKTVIPDGDGQFKAGASCESSR